MRTLGAIVAILGIVVLLILIVLSAIESDFQQATFWLLALFFVTHQARESTDES